MMELDVATVLYQGAPSMNSVLEVILAVMLQFAQLAGIGAAIAAIVNVLKTFGVVGDQTAGRWFAALNLAGIALLVYLKLFRPDIAVEYIDAQAAALAQILLLLLWRSWARVWSHTASLQISDCLTSASRSPESVRAADLREWGRRSQKPRGNQAVPYSHIWVTGAGKHPLAPADRITGKTRA
jgi:hypothetical protein